MKARDTTLGHSASLILIMRSFAGMVISPSCRSLPISAYEPPQLHEWKDSVCLIILSTETDIAPVPRACCPNICSTLKLVNETKKASLSNVT